MVILLKRPPKHPSWCLTLTVPAHNFDVVAEDVLFFLFEHSFFLKYLIIQQIPNSLDRVTLGQCILTKEPVVLRT